MRKFLIITTWQISIAPENEGQYHPQWSQYHPR